MACVLGLPSARSVATGEGRLLAGLLWLLLLNSMFLFLFCRFRLFLFFTAATADKNRRNGGKDGTEDSGGWQGASGGAVSDKRGVWFGAKPARTEAPVGAAQRRTPGGV